MFVYKRVQEEASWSGSDWYIDSLVLYLCNIDYFEHMYTQKRSSNPHSYSPFVFWEMVNFSNSINYLATQMNNETSFKQYNKERFIIVAGVKE